MGRIERNDHCVSTNCCPRCKGSNRGSETKECGKVTELLHNALHNTSLLCPMWPTVADNRTRNLLTLRAPVVDFTPVTAEVASSSLVVPAIHSKTVRLNPTTRPPPQKIRATARCVALPAKQESTLAYKHQALNATRNAPLCRVRNKASKSIALRQDLAMLPGG